MRPSIQRRLGAAVLVLGTMAALAACSTGAQQPTSTASAAGYDCSKPNADTTTKISIAALPILSTGALYAGDEQGFFKKNGLDITVQQVSTIPAAIAAVQGGTNEFGFAGTFALMQAWQNSVPLKIVAPYAGIAPDFDKKMAAGDPGYQTEVVALLTKAGSGLDNPGDLSGKTVAVSDVQGQAELTVRAAIDKHGGKASTVKFVVMSYADAYNALVAGKVDAAYSSVPILNNYKKDGLQIIDWPNVDILHEGPTSVMVSTDEYISKNPDTVARFNCALREVTAYATNHQDAVRAAYAKVQNVDPATYATSVVPYFYQSVDLTGLKRYEDLMLKYKFLNSPLDLKSFVDPVATKK